MSTGHVHSSILFLVGRLDQPSTLITRFALYKKSLVLGKVTMCEIRSRLSTIKKIKRACLFGWFLNVLVNYLVISRTGPRTERLTILRAATHETELGDHDFCLSRSHKSLY